MALAYSYSPCYEFKFDRDREFLTLRIWLSDTTMLCITDVPSLANTDLFQVRFCEQTTRYFGPSPKVGLLDKLLGSKKYRKSGDKYALLGSLQISELVARLKFDTKSKRNPLRENSVWAANPRDVWY
jgi:hypothetical protein